MKYLGALMFNINELINNRDLKGLLRVAKEFHGHICPYVALGIKVSVVAMEELNVSRLSLEGSIHEKILAMVECNNCFTDGVQITTGCTLGNNSLIYSDMGKNALTLVKRSSWEGIRIYIDSERLRTNYFPEKASELYEKVVVKRNGNPQEIGTLSKLWEETGYRILELSREELKIEHVRVTPIEQAPIFEDVRCSSCNELVMKTKIVYIKKMPYCLECAEKKHYALIGRGIVERENSIKRIVQNEKVE